jgi:hypothetical protein
MGFRFMGILLVSNHNRTVINEIAILGGLFCYFLFVNKPIGLIKRNP